MAIVLPHGVLFRGAAEGTIRKKLLEDGSIYAVIGMPANLFFGTSIPTTVIILKKNRPGRDVLFIDASNDFTKFKNQNKLEPEHIKRIVDTYKSRESIEKYSYLAPFEEIKEINSKNSRENKTQKELSQDIQNVIDKGNEKWNNSEKDRANNALELVKKHLGNEGYAYNLMDKVNDNIYMVVVLDNNTREVIGYYYSDIEKNIVVKEE